MSDIRAPDNKEDAKIDYLKGMKYKELAEKYEVSLNTIKSWVKRYGWAKEKKQKGAHKNKKGAPLKSEPISQVSNHKVKDELVVLQNADLTDKQRLFCIYYVKCFNATQSAIKAGYSKDNAHVIGSRLLRNVKVRDEIKRLKGNLAEELFIDAMDVLKKYIAIAFADISDYTKFGQREVPVMAMFGPIKDEDGNIITKLENYVDLNDYTEVDGTVLSEVSQGKNGVKIKFADRMKALEKLEKYFDLLPDKWQRKIEEEKLRICQEKLEIEKGKVGDGLDNELRIVIDYGDDNGDS